MSSGTLIVANPAAGAGRVGRLLGRLESPLRERLGPFDVALTEAPGHASVLARDAAGSVGRILALGGDGTFSEVVHGVMTAESRDVDVGLLPVGTGGDFRRMLNSSGDVLEAAEAIAASTARSVDVGLGRFGGMERYFVNILSFGIGGLVDRIVNETPKHLGGRVSFYLGTVRALGRYRPASVELTLDGELKGQFEITNILVCNGQFGGGGMHFAPSARLDDGLFDVVCVEHRSLFRILAMTAALYRGTFDRLPGVHCWRAREISAHVVGDAPAHIDLDGEALGGLPVEVALEAKALRLLAVDEGILEPIVSVYRHTPGSRGPLDTQR